MITLADLLALESLSDARPIGSAPTMFGKRVVNVGVMDVEPILGTYDTFLPGEAIFTSLGFAAGNSQVADDALERLIARKPTAVLIKDYFGYEPSAHVKDQAAQAGVALVRYKARYLEEIITEARLLIADDNQGDADTEMIRSLLEIRCSKAVDDTFSRIVDSYGAYVQALAFSSLENERLSLRALKSSMEALLPTFEQKTETGAVFRWYEQALILFCPLANADDAYGVDLMGLASISPMTSIRCGISEPLTRFDADLCVREALAALRVARESRKKPEALRFGTTVLWSDADTALFPAAFTESPLMQRAADASRALIRSYDEDRGSDLELCLRTYVTCAGSVPRTAAALHQHPNSVRNRINRARRILSCESMNERALFAYFSIIFLEDALSENPSEYP